MPVVPIILPPGVVRPSTDAVVRGRYWDANLVRWRGQHLLPVGGWERMTEASLPSVARNITPWRDLADVRRVLFLCDNHVLVLEGPVYTDITPPDFTGDDGDFTTAGYGIGPFGDGTFGSPRTGGDQRLYYRASAWSADTFGQEVLYCASSDGRLFVVKPQVTPIDSLLVTEAPTGNRGVVVTEERHVMLLAAGGNPRRVAWCSREDYTDWDFASVTNTAGFFDLDTPGWIVGGVKVRGGVLIFTDSEVWLCRYRGVPYVYGFERVGSACGIISPAARAAIGGVCYWLGKEGFWMFDGGTVRPIPCDLGSFVFDNIDPLAGVARCHASANGTFPEIWFFYPTIGQKECDRLAIMSIDPSSQWWSIAAMPRSAMREKGVYPFPLAAGSNGMLYEHETGWSNEGLPRAGTVYVETAALSLPLNGEQRINVVQAQMDHQYDSAQTQVAVFTRETHNGPEETWGPFEAREDGWTDMRFSGRDVRLRYVQTTEGNWTVGEMRFDTRKGSKR